jgi:hypothetical protein
MRGYIALKLLVLAYAFAFGGFYNFDLHNYQLGNTLLVLSIIWIITFFVVVHPLTVRQPRP